MRVRPSALAVLSVLACAGGEDRRRSQRDAGESDASDDGGIRGFEPAPPELPRLAPCPEGWREIPDVDVPDMVTCDPYPEGGAIDCRAPDEAHFPGGPGCERVGPPCPEGEWPEGLPVGPTAYVRPGAEDGDGTRLHPYGTIGEALAARRSGVIALAVGEYSEPTLVVDAPVTLWGACVAGTWIRSVDEPVLSVHPSDRTAIVRNVRVSGPVGIVADGGTVELQAVAVHDTGGTGIAVWGGATFRARDLIVRDTDGAAFTVSGGASAEIERCSFERGVENGMSASGGASLVSVDLAVRDTAARSFVRHWGVGIVVADGAHVSMDRTLVERAVFGSVNVRDATAVFEDLVVRDVLLSEPWPGGAGRALELLAGAEVEVDRGAFLGTKRAAVEVSDLEGAPPRLDARDLVIADVEADRAGGGGLGIWMSLGGTFGVERVAVLRSRIAGVLIEEDARLEGADLTVRGTRSDASGLEFGYGLFGWRGAQVDLDRAAFAGNRFVGVVAFDSGTHMTLRDLLVEGTLPRECSLEGCGCDARDPCGAAGSGVSVVDGASVEMTGFRVSDNALCGVQVSLGAGLDLHEGEISRNPVGANVQDGSFDVSRLRDRVRFLDNGRTLDSATLPVPIPTGGF